MPYPPPTPLPVLPTPAAYPIAAAAQPGRWEWALLGWLALILAAGVLLWLLARRGQRRAARGLPGLAWELKAWRRLMGLFRRGPKTETAPAAIAAPAATNSEAAPALTPEPSPAEATLQIPLPARGFAAVVAWLSAGRWKPAARFIPLLEFILITLAVWAYCAPFLNLGSSERLPGNEAEVFQALDWTLYHAVREGAFPRWNPLLHDGLPYIADPMLHAYNPVASLPVLLWGVRDGFKIAVFLSFLIAAWGMRSLGATLGVGPVLRVWMALMFAFSGQPAARFFQGQYLFIFGFAWIPWAVGGLFRTLQTWRRRDIGLTALALALMFFSGNAYYTFYMLVAAGLFALLYLFRRDAQRPGLRLNVRALLFLLEIGALALGLAAVQLLPSAEFWPRVAKSLDLAGSHTPQQIFLDYTSTDPFRPDAYQVMPAREEFYAYIGLWPFLALSLLPIAFLKRPAKPLVFFLLIVLFVVAWVDLNQMPWRESFIETRVLLQFRHLLRVLIFGSFAILTLAALGLDSLWQALRRRATLGEPPAAGLRVAGLRGAALAGMVLLAGFLLASVADVYRVNRRHLATQAISSTQYQLAAWLKAHDRTDFLVRGNPANGWHDALMSAGLRFAEAWYHFDDIRLRGNDAGMRAVNAHPEYIIQPVADEPPPYPLEIIDQPFDEWVIYRLPESLPLVFSVQDSVLRQAGGGELTRAEVTPLDFVTPDPNTVEVITDSAGGETLALLYVSYPGWQVRVDGRPAALLDLDGYLGVALQAGVHKYEFVFAPASFTTGLWISLAALAVVLALIASDIGWKAAWKTGLAEGRAAWAALRRLRAPASRWGQNRPLVRGAIHDGAALLVDEPLPWPDGERVRVTVEAAPLSPLARWGWATWELLASLGRVRSFAGVLFAAALLVYAATRLVGLDRFPITLYTDEAIHTESAAALVANGFSDADGVLLPTYFKNGVYYNLSASVYVQVIPYLLFGKSAVVTRGVSALISCFAAAALGLMLKHTFKLRYWWAGALVFALIPAWFLHARTAFETAEFVSFYTLFLYAYLRYRDGERRYLFGALLFAGLAFYAYSPGRMVLLVSGVLLLLADLPVHWQNRRMTIPVLLVAAVLAAPLLRFMLLHPTALSDQLRDLGSYWMQPLPMVEKVNRYIAEYLYGLSPAYWLNPAAEGLERHRLDDYGNLLAAFAPLALIGLWIALSNWRKPGYRALLIALLAGPSGSALVGIGVTRVLVMVAPLAALVTIGLSRLLEWFTHPPAGSGQNASPPPAEEFPRWNRILASGVGLLLAGGWLFLYFRVLDSANRTTFRQLAAIAAGTILLLAAARLTGRLAENALARWRGKLPETWLALALGGALTLGSLHMLNDALTQGPRWYSEYGLYGVQFGAFEVFPAIEEIIANDPATQVICSPGWANGTDVVMRFFLPEGLPVSMGSIEGHIYERKPLDENTLFVMTPVEYERAQSSGKFTDIQVERTIAYPNGQPGFYFVRLAYVDEIEQLLEADRAQRRQLQEGVVAIGGESAAVKYSMLDMGVIADMFDGNPNTVARTFEANPLVIELTFPRPMRFSGVSVRLGTTTARITAALTPEDGGDAVEFTETLKGTMEQPQVTLSFEQPVTAAVLRLEIFDLYQPEPAHIHIWEIELLP